MARKSKVSRNTVRRILRQGTSGSTQCTALGRPRAATAFESTVQPILDAENDLPTVEILRRLRDQGHSEGKDPVYRLVRRLPKIVTLPMARSEGLAGGFSQIDFGRVRVRYDDGTQELLHCFASRLKWSRWVHVELVPNEQVEAQVRALLNASSPSAAFPWRVSSTIRRPS